jgi:hypothetical protein
MGLIADENSQHGPHCCSSHIRFALRKQLPRMWQSDGPLAPHCYHCALGTIYTVIMGKKRKAASDGVDGAPKSKKRSRSEKAEKFNGNATDHKGLVYRTPSASKRADDS